MEMLYARCDFALCVLIILVNHDLHLRCVRLPYDIN